MQSQPENVQTIAGLEERIDSAGMAKPIMSISGYEGAGTITSITPSDVTAGFNPVDASGIAQPKVVAATGALNGVH